MNEQQLQELAKTLNVDPSVLILLNTKYKPASETALIQLLNTIRAQQNELDLPTIEQAIDQFTPEGMDQPQASAVNFSEYFADGYQFARRGINDLAGQCAWFAEQITRLADGSNWTIGNSINEKKQQLNQHVAQGNAFLKGQETPQVGNSVVMDTGTQYGHVAVVSEVLPDGRLRLTESNWGGDLKVSHNRIVDPNDAEIVGFVKSKPTREFKTGPSQTPAQTPTTPKQRQPAIVAPQGKQELPREMQQVKVDDIEANNPNVEQLVKTTGVPKEQIAASVQNKPFGADVEDQARILKSEQLGASQNAAGSSQLVNKPAQETPVAQGPGTTPLPAPAPTPVLETPQPSPTATPQATPSPTPAPAQPLSNVNEELLAMVPPAQQEAARKAIPYLEQALRKEGIYSPKVLGYALATVSHESGFVPKEETMAQRGVNPRNDYIAGLQQNYEGGTDYRGRGFIQLTHKSNYDKYGQRIGEDLVNNPDRLLDTDVSAKVTAAYFKDSGVADAVEKGDYDTARVRVQGRGALNSEFIGNTRAIAKMAQDITKASEKNFNPNPPQVTPSPTPVPVAAAPKSTVPVAQPKPNLISTFTKSVGDAVSGINLSVPKAQATSPIKKPPVVQKPAMSFNNPAKPSVKPVVQSTRTLPPKITQPMPKISVPKVQTPVRTPTKYRSTPVRQSMASTAKNAIKKISGYFKR